MTWSSGLGTSSVQGRPLGAGRLTSVGTVGTVDLMVWPILDARAWFVFDISSDSQDFVQRTLVPGTQYLLEGLCEGSPDLVRLQAPGVNSLPFSPLLVYSALLPMLVAGGFLTPCH